MFGLFKSKPYRDAQLGEFRKSGGYWRGSIVLASGTFGLSLAGDRVAPSPRAIELARELRQRFPTLVIPIQNGLFEHYLPYKEAIDAGVLTGSECPQITGTDGVWSHVKPAHVLIESVGGQWRVEVAFATAWDIEHTVAALFSDWRFIELNGSVRRQKF